MIICILLSLYFLKVPTFHSSLGVWKCCLEGPSKHHARTHSSRMSSAFTKANTEVIEGINIVRKDERLANICILFVIVGVIAILATAIVAYIISGLYSLHYFKDFTISYREICLWRAAGCTSQWEEKIQWDKNYPHWASCWIFLQEWLGGQGGGEERMCREWELGTWGWGGVCQGWSRERNLTQFIIK